MPRTSARMSTAAFREKTAFSAYAAPENGRRKIPDIPTLDKSRNSPFLKSCGTEEKNSAFRAQTVPLRPPEKRSGPPFGIKMHRPFRVP